jgi:hypothetical protein
MTRGRTGGEKAVTHHQNRDERKKENCVSLVTSPEPLILRMKESRPQKD